MILSTSRYGEEAYGSASKAVLKKLEPTQNRGIRLGVFAVCRTENALCEAGVSTLADMRNLNTTITAIRFISNPNHPIRPYFLSSTKLDDYALRSAAPKTLFVRAMEQLGKLQIDTRKMNDRHSFLGHHGRISTITDSITNYARSDEAQATKTKDSKLKLFAFSTKSTNITAKYTQRERKKKKRSDME
jgi:hypothetical protein